jgi:hypothetical protein
MRWTLKNDQTDLSFPKGGLEFLRTKKQRLSERMTVVSKTNEAKAVFQNGFAKR